MNHRMMDEGPQWLKHMLQSLEGLEYGTIQIVVHDSQVTQIERVERRRFSLEQTRKRDKVQRSNGQL
ncbi:YezD family protein [Alicyclobacillus pomorum]|uniref:YezD family protein n=1 Tax=Alicyclobacillus pomorum TaxID=204470 RepID=UPI00316AC7DB